VTPGRPKNPAPSVFAVPPVDESSIIYDIALSFLNHDVQLAGAIERELSKTLRVFYYPNRQQDLAGRQGNEAFTRVFEHESRLAVILHRDGWGKTEFTHAEERGILARGHHFRYKSLFCLVLDDAPLPSWIGEDRTIWFDLRVFPIEQAIGAIRLRAQDNGAVLRHETALERGVRLDSEATAARERQQLLRSEAGAKLAYAEVGKLYESLRELFSQYEERTGIRGLGYGYGERRFVVRFPKFSTAIVWDIQYTNTVDGAKLLVEEYWGGLVLPSEDARYGRRPVVLRDFRFTFTLTAAGPAWVSAKALRDWIANRFFDRLADDHDDRAVLERRLRERDPGSRGSSHDFEF
jgi:hypothetical protein